VGTIVTGTASTEGYGEAADELARQYESVEFADVHRDVLHLFPTPVGRILDIGAGSGRDAAALARLGHKVVAAEPVAALRQLGQRLHAAANIEWVDDALPDLAVLRRAATRFDLILLTAVWMHLDEPERVRAMESIAALLAPDGRLIMSLRHGPVPTGRRMFEVSAEETAALGKRYGLRAIHHGERNDPLKREQVHWSVVGMRRDVVT
jgi:SAM-dependent methyltransferase